jgi:hypothetical protein
MFSLWVTKRRLPTALIHQLPFSTAYKCARASFGVGACLGVSCGFRGASYYLHLYKISYENIIEKSVIYVYKCAHVFVWFMSEYKRIWQQRPGSYAELCTEWWNDGKRQTSECQIRVESVAIVLNDEEAIRFGGRSVHRGRRECFAPTRVNTVRKGNE